MRIPLQVHSGEPINDDFFIEVWNDPEGYGSVYRPQGGYWLSEYTPNDEYPSQWMRFVYNSKDSMILDQHSRPYYCIYQVSDEANIYTINSYNDLLILIMKYPLTEENGVYIDFERAAEDWDGIYLTNNGFEACKYPDEEKLEECKFKGRNKPTLSGWEIPCLLITNPKNLTLIGKKENSRYIEPD